MPLFMVEFIDGTDGKSTVCQPVVAPSADHAADIAYGIAGHIAYTGTARVISMTVSGAAGCEPRVPVIIDTPVTYADFTTHVTAWMLHYSDGRADMDDAPEYPFDAAYAGDTHASGVAIDALRMIGVRA